MIVKNEAKIITRLFDSVKDIIDDYVIIDTGSTDNTKEVIKNYWNQYNINGHIIDIPFKNFGYNRTQGLIKAKENSNSDFVLLLDADMIVKNINFDKKELIGKRAITLKQKNRFIEYRNLRLVKRDLGATCVGVTHEYYDTKNAPMEKIDSLYIEDIGDGGAKADKFERDIRLLKQGIIDEPNNARYYFYLAQSYKDIGDIDNAIENYKKHISIPGWDEEVWYSHYMISRLYLSKNMPNEAEHWAMKGFSFRPIRSEALYHLCVYFKNNKNYQKAYSYYKLAESLPYPKDDILFVEYKIYDHDLDFEYSIINYYLKHVDKREGIKACLDVLNSAIDDKSKDLTLKNMSFYINSLSQSDKFKFQPYSKDHIIIDDVRYNFSSSSILKLNNKKIANIRTVSYTFTNNPMVFAADKKGLKATKNLHYDFEKDTYSLMKEVILDQDKHEKVETHICGIEDIRLYSCGDKIKFIGQSSEFKNKNTEIYFNMVNGTYDIDNLELKIEKILESPYSSKVEKNWIHLKDDKFIYSWNPLHIGTLEDKYFAITDLVKTPSFFKHFKGSSNAFYFKNMFWVITHYTTDTWNQNGLYRQYKHCLVLLDDKFNPVCYSDPFTIENAEVEFNLGLTIDNNKLIFGYSKNEKDGSYGEIEIDYFIDKFNFINKDLFFFNITR